MSTAASALNNLKSRVSRIYFAERDFTDNNGKVVKYERLVIEVLVKGELFPIELKPDKKDKAIFILADDLSQPPVFS